MNTIRLEQLNNEKFRENLFNEATAMYRLLGINEDKCEINVLAGDKIAKCTLSRPYGSVRATVHFDNTEYNIKVLSLEEGVYFSWEPDAVIKVEYLRENTRSILDNEPRFIVTNAYIKSLNYIDRYSFNKENQITIRCNFEEYVEVVEMHRLMLCWIAEENMKSISVELNYSLLYNLDIDFSSLFFRYNEKVSEMAKIIQCDKIGSILFGEEHIMFQGPDKDWFYMDETNSENEEDKKIVNLVLEYIFEQLKWHFKNFGIEVNIIWEE